MDRAEKMDCRSNGEVIFTGATTEFQLRKGLTQKKGRLINSYDPEANTSIRGDTFIHNMASVWDTEILYDFLNRVIKNLDNPIVC